MINDWIQPCVSLVRRRLMRISRISNRPPLARFCILANSPLTKPSINPFSRRTTEWRRGNSVIQSPDGIPPTLLVGCIELPLISFLSIFFFSHIYFRFFLFFLSLSFPPFSFASFVKRRLFFKHDDSLDNWTGRSKFSQIIE